MDYLGHNDLFSLAILAVNTVFAQGSPSSGLASLWWANHAQKRWPDGLATT